MKKARRYFARSDVLAALHSACDAAGSPTRYAAQIGVSDEYVLGVLRGVREPGPAIYEPLGFTKIARYLRHAGSAA